MAIFHTLLIAAMGLWSPAVHHLVGKEAVDFRLPSLQGESMALHQFRGQVVILGFWATWSEHSLRGLPEFERLNARYRTQGLALLMVSVDGNPKNVRAFMKKNDVRLTTLWDANKQVFSRYTTETVPATFVIDRYGVVRYVHTRSSPAEFKRLEAEIRELLDEL